MSTIVLANQAVMTTPRPKLTPDLTFLTSVTYVLICNMPILDDKQIWTHMTTQVVNTKQYWPLQDLSWPRIWHSWPQLPMLWYATCPYLMTNWFEHLWPPYYGPPKLSWPLQDLNLPWIWHSWPQIPKLWYTNAILDIQIWTPMTTLVMTPQAVMTNPWPELTQGLTFLTSNTYA